MIASMNSLTNTFARRAGHLRRLVAGCLAAGITATLLMPTSAYAQEGEGTIEGRVLSAQTGRYLTRALVSIEGTSEQAFTNQFGEYELYGIPAGTVTLNVFFTGMSSAEATVEVIAGDTVVQDFTLLGENVARTPQDGEEGFELAEFEVSASDSFETASEIAIQQERFSVNLKNVVSTDAYGLIAQGNVGEFVKYIPGVTIGYGGGNTAGGTYASGADANTISIRGYSARETSITIDGIPIANAAPGTLDPATGLEMMSINNAARVEVIKVPSPDEPNAGIGGRVNLVSKTAFEYPKPTLNYRVYVSMNSENLEVFNKTPGPMNERTYKTLPSFNMTYAVPLNDKLGFSLTLASANQAGEGQALETRVTRDPTEAAPEEFDIDEVEEFDAGDYNYWLQEDPRFAGWQSQYGEDWENWTEEEFLEMYMASGLTENEALGFLEDVKRLPRYDAAGNLVGAWSPADREAYQGLPEYYDAEGNLVGRVFNDWGHPFIERVEVTDSPRISHRNSGALKVDWRPLDGLVVTANYQVSTFEDQSADRRVHQIIDEPTRYGVDYVISDEGGSVRMDTDAFSRSGVTQSGYLKASYIKGPWDVSGHYSYSTSESDIETAEAGHFSVIELTMGNVDYTEFRDISSEGVPQIINHYRDILDAEGNVIGQEKINISDISNYAIANFDPEDPQAGTLKARTAGITSESEVTSIKFDIKRDLDFIPGDFMNLAIKVGADRMETTKTKGGRGVNYEYIYLGLEEGDGLDVTDFRDETYVGVDPGFGLEPLEWPDPYGLYNYMLEHPGSFSDTHDEVIEGSDEVSTAHHNYHESVNSSKSITEIETAYYAQLEGDFFNNRLSIVGGFRMGENERKGYAPLEYSDWNYLHFDRDQEGNGLRDVFETETLARFDVSNPALLARHRVDSFEELSEADQQEVMAVWMQYEEAGAVYADGAPFIASEFVPVDPKKLRAAQLQYIKDFEIDQKAVSQPQPIISAAYDITDRLTARLSWSTSYSNPPYEDSEGEAGTLRDVSYNENPDGSGSMDVTNPELDVAKTIGWDAGLAYYTDAGGKFAVNVYYRTEHERAIGVTYSQANSPEAWDAVMRSLGYGPGHRYYENEWDVTTSINADSTFIDYGYELEARQDLAFLGDWGKYFYLYASFFQKFNKAGDIPQDEAGEFDVVEDDQIELNASGGISMDYKRLSVQANFTWQNERTTRITSGIFWDDPTIGNPGWYTPIESDNEPTSYERGLELVSPEDLRIDLTVGYRLTDRLTLDFSARNITESYPLEIYKLTDEGRLPLYGHLEDRGQAQSYGINFTIGLSGHF